MIESRSQSESGAQAEDSHENNRLTKWTLFWKFFNMHIHGRYLNAD